MRNLICQTQGSLNVILIGTIPARRIISNVARQNIRQIVTMAHLALGLGFEMQPGAGRVLVQFVLGRQFTPHSHDSSVYLCCQPIASDLPVSLINVLGQQVIPVDAKVIATV